MKDRNIQIKNIYYMLTYAFQVLRQTNYEEIASEEFENIHDLFAAILIKGVTQQLKQGLYREYLTYGESLPLLRGKINIAPTMRHKAKCERLLSCEHDDLSVNNIYNRIIKTTMIVLMKHASLAAPRKDGLKKILPFFSGVEEMKISLIKWDTLRFRRNNQSYKMLMNVCYFVLSGLLLSDEKGQMRMEAFLDEQRMCRLYEKFILEFYRYHYKGVLSVSSSQIKWNLDGGAFEFLPVMQSDVMLEYGGKTLIIDAKYYSRTMQKREEYGAFTLHSNNLYQIFTYVKNRDRNHDGSVSGLLLYAKTDETIVPDNTYSMSGNEIGVKTLDLNLPFPSIAAKLRKIVSDAFGICSRSYSGPGTAERVYLSESR